MIVVYLIGYPGAGKTTLTRTLRERFFVKDEPTAPFKHTILVDDDGVRRYVELGHARPPFGGTDSLGMAVNPKACEWISGRPYDRILGEGDRLANARFFAAASAAGSLKVVWLDVPGELAYERRARRAADHGLPMQSPSWVAGRVSKTDNLVSAQEVVRIDGQLPADAQADRLSSLLGLS